ncbi:MAG: NAD(P)/FAD-dependent oxidoreductase [Gemmataceae bacterium]
MTIATTLHPREASERTWDVAIVGAGPSGALAARELARRGLSVLLIDRSSFPRWKVCGCCLNGHALGILSAVGLGSLMSRSGAIPLRGFRVAVAGHFAEVPLSGGVALSRESFDAALVQAAIEEGADFLPRTLASLDSELGNSAIRYLELQQGPTRARLAARVVLAADGLGGKLAARAEGSNPITKPASRIGAGVIAATGPACYAPGQIFMACGRGGYVGLVRLEDGRLNLAAALDPNWVRGCGGPGRAAVELLADSGWPAVPNLAELNWRGTPSLTRRAWRRAGHRLFLIGDAAGYIEPFTGEGMAWALTAGRAVAPLAARAAQRWHPVLAREWEMAYRHVLGRRQLICQGVAAVLRSPKLMRTLVWLLARVPVLAKPLTQHLGCAENTRFPIRKEK